jgi:hypothetical protein
VITPRSSYHPHHRPASITAILRDAIFVCDRATRDRSSDAATFTTERSDDADIACHRDIRRPSGRVYLPTADARTVAASREHTRGAQQSERLTHPSRTRYRAVTSTCIPPHSDLAGRCLSARTCVARAFSSPIALELDPCAHTHRLRGLGAPASYLSTARRRLRGIHRSVRPRPANRHQARRAFCPVGR